MDKEKAIKTSWYIFLAAMAVLTILFFFEMKFVVVGINILVFDALFAGVWMFVRLCKWAGRENTGRRIAALIAVTLVGLLAVFVLAMDSGLYEYAEGTEPQTRRTFVVEYRRNMFHNGTAKVYERFGPLLFPCDVPEYSGELFLDEFDAEYGNVHLNEKGDVIIVSLFVYGPRFRVPINQTAEPTKTPQQALLEEQLVDDMHDAFLLDTKGDLGTLLITAEQGFIPSASGRTGTTWSVCGRFIFMGLSRAI